MSDSFDVHVVHYLQHLLEVIAANIDWESLNRNIIEQFASSNQFEGHVCNRDLFSIGFDPYCVVSEVNQFNHVTMG